MTFAAKVYLVLARMDKNASNMKIAVKFIGLRYYLDPGPRIQPVKSLFLSPAKTTDMEWLCNSLIEMTIETAGLP